MLVVAPKEYVSRVLEAIKRKRSPIGPIFKWKEKDRSRPGWKEVTSKSPTLKAIWVQ